MTLSDEQIQDLLRVGNPTDEERRLIRLGWDAAMRTKSAPDGWKLVPVEPTPSMKTAGIGVEVYQDSPPATDCLTWKEVEAIYTAMIEVTPEGK